MSKLINASSPIKNRQGSISERPFYMPQIHKSKSSQQTYGSPGGRGGSPSKIISTEMNSSRLESNHSLVWEDIQPKTEDLETAPSPYSNRPRYSPTKDAKYSSPSVNNKMGAEFRSKLFQRSGSDLIKFKEIFIAPKQRLIKGMHEKDKGSLVDLSQRSFREYEKSFMETTKEDSQYKHSLSPVKSIKQPSMRSFSQAHLSLQPIEQKTIIRKNSVDNSESPTKEIILPREIPLDDIQLKNEENLVQDQNSETHKIPKERLIFEFQVKVQVPKSYNMPGSQSPRDKDFAPSLYQSNVIHSPRMNLKDFTMRNRAVSIKTKVEDLAKDGNLNFDIGTLHEERKEYKKAILAFDKYLHNVKNIKDKVGIVLALNRLGINYFHLRKYQKSLENHLLTLEITNVVDCFVAYYNIGLTLRKIRNYTQALIYLQKALDWAREFKDPESECITFGQIAITYLEMKDYEASKESFQSCYNLTVQLKHIKLQLDCLINLSKVCRASKKWDSKIKSELWKIYNQGYSCAKKIEKNRTAEICLCNMGVLEGLQKFSTYSKNFNLKAIKGLYD